MRNKPNHLTLGALLIILLVFLLVSCNLEKLKTLKSPVQAVTTLFEQTDGTVEAELILISTSDAKNHEFITTAEKVKLRMPEGDIVELIQKENGHYRANSKDNQKLVYHSEKTYQFKFDLPSEAEEEGVHPGNFVATTETPKDKVEFSWKKKPGFSGDTSELTWKPTSLKGIITVYGPDNKITYSTFDFSKPQFSGDKWARLGAFGKITLSVDVFPKPGDYRVVMCGVNKKSGFDKQLSADLGVLSGFLAGTCAQTETLTVGE